MSAFLNRTLTSDPIEKSLTIAEVSTSQILQVLSPEAVSNFEPSADQEHA